MTEDEAIDIYVRNAVKHGQVASIAILQAVAVGRLTNAVRSIAYGGQSGATGLEALCMAVAGRGAGTPPGEALQRLVDVMGDLNTNVERALDRVAEESTR